MLIYKFNHDSKLLLVLKLEYADEWHWTTLHKTEQQQENHIFEIISQVADCEMSSKTTEEHNLR